MTERILLQHSPEAALPSGEHHEKLAEKANAELEPAHANNEHHKPEKHPLQQIEQARATIEQAAETTVSNPLEQLTTSEKTTEPMSPRRVDKELRQISLRNELQQIRRQLPRPVRTFSRVIHQPVIRVVSEAAGKTVSRPSGLLGGGLLALIGTSTYLYLAEHLGFRYNYVVFLALFVAGFAIGLGLELIIHLATSSRRQPHD